MTRKAISIDEIVAIVFLNFNLLFRKLTKGFNSNEITIAIMQYKITVAIWYKKNKTKQEATNMATALTIPIDNSFDVIYFFLAKIKKTHHIMVSFTN